MHQKRRDVDIHIVISNTISSKDNSLKIFNKKAQITIYIILGFILLLVLALVLTFQFSITKSKPEGVLPGGQGKVSNYLTSCIEQIAKDGLIKMGEQGGYINVPKDLELDGARHLRTSPITVIPYWAYGTTEAVPNLAQLKERLDNHIQQNLRDCILNSSGLKEAYNIIEKSEISSNTKIHPKGISFNINWVLEIRDKAGEVITEIDEHTYESKIKLENIHTLAKSIINAELQQFKLEDLTQDMISLDHPKLPVSGIEYSCSKKKWKFDEAKETLQTMLRINLAELQVKGTKVTPHSDDLPYYQNHYVWDISNTTTPSDYTDISLQFYYDNNYPFTFEVSPRAGNTLQSENLIPKSKYIPFLCLQMWKFAYDVTYPVLVTLTDETTGYKFKVSFTVELENNYANRNGFKKQNRPILINTQTDDDYCAAAKTSMIVKTEEIVDNPFTGVHTTEPLPNANITFICLKYDCNIGQTEYNFGGMQGIASLRTNFPPCVGGFLRSSAPYYTDAQKRIIVEANQEITLQSSPIYPISLDKIKIKTHPLISSGPTDPEETPDEKKIGAGVELKDTQVALIKISFDRGNSTWNPLHLPNHESQVVFAPLLEKDIASSQNLILLAKAEFTYDVDIQIYEDENLVSAYKGNWTVPWEDLEYASSLTFHTINIPTDNDALYDFFQNLPQESLRVPPPEFS